MAFTAFHQSGSFGVTPYGKLKPDLLQADDNGGVIFLIDPAHPSSYPGGPKTGRAVAASPVSGQTVTNVSKQLLNTSANWVIPNGQSVVFTAGKLFDLSGVTGAGGYLSIPAAIAADLWTPVNGNSQQFLFATWLKFPDSSTWTELVNGNSYPLIHWAGPTGFYGSKPEICHFGLDRAGNLAAAIQYGNANQVTMVTLNSPAANLHRGKLALVAFYRSAGGLGVYVQSSAGRSVQPAAINALNQIDYSGRDGRLGIGTSIWPSNGIVNGSKWSFGRTFIENLARSGRDPQTVLDAEYIRVMARNVYNLT